MILLLAKLAIILNPFTYPWAWVMLLLIVKQ